VVASLSGQQKWSDVTLFPDVFEDEESPPLRERVGDAAPKHVQGRAGRHGNLPHRADLLRDAVPLGAAPEGHEEHSSRKVLEHLPVVADRRD
jgi:hypothetical protein